MVVFRADANGATGAGHIVRCIAIAKEVVRQGGEVLFVTADAYSRAFLNREGLDQIVLGTDCARMEEEIAAFSAILKKVGVDCVLVDSYHATAGYLKQLTVSARVAYMDDLGSKLYPTDMIINYNAYSDEIPYDRMYGNSGIKLLLGPAYAPLREEFRFVRIKPIADKIGDIMITTGGTDPCNVSCSLAKRLSQDSDFKGIHLHIVAGRYYKDDSELKQISAYLSPSGRA